MTKQRFHHVVKRSQTPAASGRLTVARLEDRLAPAVFTVDSLLDTASPPAGTVTLRSAITAADANRNTDPAHPDVINLAVAGTITLDSDLPMITGSLSIQGPGAADLTVLGPTDANPDTQSGVLGVASAGTATVSGLTVDGNAANPCVFVDINGTVALQADTIRHGNGYFGGGISAIIAYVTVSDSTITANLGQFAGGAIYTGGNLTITRSTISNNSTSGDGGGIDIFHGLPQTTFTVTATTFSGNVASNHGGAINLTDGVVAVNRLSATIADSTFVGNAAFFGGALSLRNSFSSNTISLSVGASTITQNADVNYGTGELGGGLFVNDGAGPVRLFNTILAGNGEGSLNGQKQIVNNNLADDVAGALDPAGADNLIGAPSGPTGLTDGFNGNQIGSSAAPINPLLGPLQDNGGPTQTVLPLPGSPALDRGGADPVLAGLGTSTDQRGRPRVVSLGLTTPPAYSDGRDVGATEGQVTMLTVNTTSDAATPPDGTLTLRQALQVADGALPTSSVPPTQITAGDAGFYQIEFTLPAASTITLTSALPAVTAGVAILGPGAGALTLQGDGATVRSVAVSSGGSGYTTPPQVTFTPAPPGGTTATGVAVVQNGQVVGVTLTNPGFGYATAPIISFGGPGTGATAFATLAADPLLTVSPGAVVQVSGLTLDGNQNTNAGISATGATLLVQDAVIRRVYTSTSGAGINNQGGTVSVVRTQFLNDTAAVGGGGIASVGGSLDVRQSTFDGDVSSGGAAIYNVADGGGTLFVLDSTFVNNTASGRGGALDLEPGSRATVIDSTFTGNYASGGGGAIGVYGLSTNLSIPSSLTLSGSTLSGNLNSRVSLGGGLYVQGSATALVRDTIVAGNKTSSGMPSDVSGALDPASAYDLIGAGAGLTGINPGVNGNLIGTAAAPVDPKLGPLTSNGGPTQTLVPLPGSPAIDHGAADPLADGLTPTDQAGNPRVVGQPFTLSPAGGDARDIGAYELPAQTTPTVLTVNSLADADPPAGVLTLRQALQAADGLIPLSGLPASQVNVGSPYWFEVPITVSGAIVLASPLPAVSTAVALRGPGAGALAVQGDGTTVAKITAINGGSGYTTPPQVTFTPAPPGGTTATGVAVVQNGQVVGVTLTNPGFGYATAPIISFGGPGTGASASAILAADPVLTVAVGAAAGVAGLTLDGNRDVNAGITVAAGGSLLVQDAVIQFAASGGSGGGILSQGGTVNVVRARFLNDVAGNGGGGAIAALGGQLTVSQSTFTGNFASGGGGAIYTTANAAGGGNTLLVLDSTFANNQTVGRGGAVDLEPGSTATVADATFTGNYASKGGGALGVFALSATVNLPSSLVLSSSTLFGNQAGAGTGGGGLYVQGNDTATALVRDTIVAGNRTFNGPAADAFGTLDPASDHNLIGDGTGLTGIENGVDANQVGTAAAPIDPKLGPLADNGGPTQTFALLPGSPAVDAGGNPANRATDQRGLPRVSGPAADIGAFEVQVPPTIRSVAVNGGAAQRSIVTTVSVTFSAQVSFASTAAAAFSLIRVGDGAAVTFTATVAIVNGATVVTLGGFTGPATQFGSLADGRYTLRVLASQVSANGVALDGDGDGTAGGDYVSPPDTYHGSGLRLYRLFGDVNGDGVVDAIDLGQFRSTFNSNSAQANYLAFLDANGDGVVDAIDLGQFRARFNTNVF